MIVTRSKQLPLKHMKQDCFFLYAFLSVAVFLFWKCRYGFGDIDESFYLTIPYRLIQGDSLFTNEWHLSQMSGVLTLPIVSAFLKITGGTDGIILAIRYITTALQCFIALYLYFHLKNMNWLGAVVATLSYMLYIPFGIMALSYNSMGIMFLILFILLQFPNKRLPRTSCVASGLCFAGAVLCCPYLVVVFALFFLALCIIQSRSNRNKFQMCTMEELAPLKHALWVTLGAFLAAVAFAIFVLSRATIGDILQAFPHILNDPEHPPIPLLINIRHYFGAIALATGSSIYIYAFIAIVFCICFFDKSRKSRRLFYYAIAWICTIILMVTHYWQIRYINAVLWSINVLGVFIALLTDKAIVRQLFYSFWFTGMLYSLCLHLCSNQRFFAISSAASVATIGTIMMIAIFTQELEFAKNNKHFQKLPAMLLLILFGVQLFTQAELRYSSVFWSNGMSEQTEYIENSIQAGLYISEDSAKLYSQKAEDLNALQAYDRDSVLYLSRNTWYYLMDDSNMASYSAWLAGVSEHTISRLEAYYSLDMNKLPDLVYVDLEHEDIAYLFAEKFSYNICYDAGGLVLTQ